MASNAKDDNISTSIMRLSNVIEDLQKRESDLLGVIITTPTNPDNNRLQMQYLVLNGKKWKIETQIMALQKAQLQKKVLISMKQAASTIKHTLRYVNNEINEFDINILNNTIIHLKNSSNETRDIRKAFIQKQNEFQQCIIKRNNIFKQLSNTTNDQQAVEEEQNLIKHITDNMNNTVESLATKHLEQQRIALREAKGNVFMINTINNSNLLYKLLVGDGQFSKNDINNEINDMDDAIHRLKTCMNVLQTIINELHNEANDANASQIDNIVLSTGAKITNCQRALLTIQDIKMDYDITQFLNNKINAISKHIHSLTTDIDVFRNNAKAFVKKNQKKNALTMLKRKKYCELQRDEYKRKMLVLQNAVKKIDIIDDGDNEDNNNNVDDEDVIEQKQSDDNVTAVRSAIEEIINVQEKKSEDVHDNDDGNEEIVQKDYTKWDTDDIVNWMIGLDSNKYSKYEDALRNNIGKQMVNGDGLGMLNENDLQSFGILDLDDAKDIIKQIEQFVSNYNEDLMDEMYDDEGDVAGYI